MPISGVPVYRVEAGSARRFDARRGDLVPVALACAVTLQPGRQPGRELRHGRNGNRRFVLQIERAGCDS